MSKRVDSNTKRHGDWIIHRNSVRTVKTNVLTLHREVIAPAEHVARAVCVPLCCAALTLTCRITRTVMTAPSRISPVAGLLVTVAVRNIVRSNPAGCAGCVALGAASDECYCTYEPGTTKISGVPRGGGVNPPPRNSEDIGGILDRTSKKNRRLDFLL